jgi:hypothetical protein
MWWDHRCGILIPGQLRVHDWRGGLCAHCLGTSFYSSIEIKLSTQDKPVDGQNKSIFVFNGKSSRLVIQFWHGWREPRLSFCVNATQHHEGVSKGTFCLPMGWDCQDLHLPYRSGLYEGCSPLESGEDASNYCPWFVIGWRQSEKLENTVEENEIRETRLKHWS